ncbi:MAG: IS110 family transposase [Acidimicrobiia bacterium]|nr:IS110 family transposase [Acidimicrobiia bacterium]
MGMFAGIDWGGKHHQLAVVDDDGRTVSNERFGHDVEGVTELISVLDGHRSSLEGVAIERADGLLVEALQHVGLTVYAVSPRVSARARERYQAAARKSDRFDAYVLADTFRSDGWRWRPLAVPSPLLAELGAVVRHRRQCARSQLAVEAQLRAALEAYHPGVIALFSAVDRDATLAFLRDYPTPEMAFRVGTVRMEQFQRRVGYSGRVPADVLVERLRSHLLSGSAGSVNGHRYGALALTDQLELLNNHLRGYDRKVGDLFERHPDGGIYASFPAAGPLIGPELLTEIGEDRERFPTPGVLLAEAGLAPVTLASGKVQRVRIRHACNRRLRSTCTNWAYVLKRIDPPSRTRYLAGLDRGQLKHRALRGVGASWMRVLWRCWQDHTPYDPQRHRSN